MHDSPGIRSYRDCIKARLPPPVAPHEPCKISPGLWPSRRVCPFPSLCLSHWRCRGAWHAKPFLQICMCSNYSISNKSGGYHFHTRRSQGSLAWLLSCEHCKHEDLVNCRSQSESAGGLQLFFIALQTQLCENMDLKHDDVRLSVIITDAWCYAA